jgi:Bacterial Ig-like domain (group 3)/Beta-propeller repeat
LVYSSYLDNNGTGIAVDSAGNAYVAGWTLKSRPRPERDYASVTKINSTGSALVYSTDLSNSGGRMGSGIAEDSMGNAQVIGWTRKGLKTYADAFMTKMNPAGSALVYSADLGGSGNSGGSDIAVDSAGNAYITGSTTATTFPVTSGAFVSKINPLAATTIMLLSSPNPSTYGQAATFTAVVTSGLGAPPDGEPVSFMNGTTVLGMGTLNGGAASFTTSAMPVGTDYIKAVYSGDSNFAASTSKAVSQVVGKATTTTTLASSQNPSNFGRL